MIIDLLSLYDYKMNPIIISTFWSTMVLMTIIIKTLLMLDAKVAFCI